MQSRWDDAEAARIEAAAGEDPADRALALRVYSSQLIGQEPDLVLHGGGNTSVKVQRRDDRGQLRDVIHVKGSGWDLAIIEAPGLPGMWLDPLLKARDIPDMADEEMVRFLRAEMLDQSGPTPSVEALMHAFLPGKVVDHTHSAATLALANQPDAADIARRIYGERLCLVPYVMPGFALSHAADRIFSRDGAESEGMFLVNHGLFSFGEDARTSYERILRFTTECEDFLVANGAGLAGPESGTRVSNLPTEARALADALATNAPFADGLHVDLRSSPAIDRFLALPDLAEISARGTVTPDHVIRIKPRPVLGAAGFSSGDWDRALRDYADWYQAYFNRNAARATEPKTMLDPMPRVALIPGVGIVGVGRNAKEAGIAADLAEQSARVIWSAERFGRFTPLGEADLFDMEYWSLEQAKLRKAG